MKFLKVFFTSVILLFVSSYVVYAEGVKIVVEESIVGNAIYEVLDENKSNYEDGTEFVLIDKAGNIVAETVTEGSTIIFVNVPFGDYLLCPKHDKSKILPVAFSKDTLETQHIKKVVEFDLESEKTPPSYVVDYTQEDSETDGSIVNNSDTNESPSINDTSKEDTKDKTKYNVNDADEVTVHKTNLKFIPYLLLVLVIIVLLVYNRKTLSKLFAKLFVLVGVILLFSPINSNAYAEERDNMVNVTIPANVNIVFNSDGSNSSSEFSVSNESLVPIVVHDIKVASQNNWSLVSNGTQIPTNTRKMSLSVDNKSLAVGSNLVSILVPETSKKILPVNSTRGPWVTSFKESAFTMDIAYSIGVKKFNLSFDSNGGNAVNSISAYNGASVTLPSVTREGYTFTGWKDTNGIVYKEGSSYIMPIGGSTLTAQWSINSYTLDLNTYLDDVGMWSGGKHFTADLYINGVLEKQGVNDLVSKYPYGTKYELKNIKASKGYTYHSDLSKNLSGTIHAIDKNEILLYFSTNSVKVKYEGNGSTSGSMSEHTLKYGSNELLKPNAFAKTGYSFGSWEPRMVTSDGITKYRYRSSDDKVYGWFEEGKHPSGYIKVLWTNASDATHTFIKNGATIICKAIWTPNKYNVEYNGNGATSGSIPSHTVVYDVASPTKKNSFVRTGYNFKGWNLSKVLDSKTLWSYDAGDGTVQWYEEGKQPQGYYKHLYPDGFDIIRASSVYNDTVTLHAQWESITYSVIYNGNGSTSGSMPNSTQVSYDVGATLQKNLFSRTGYTFTGWSASRKSDGLTRYLNPSDNTTEWYADGKQPSGWVYYQYKDEQEIFWTTTVDKDLVTMSAQWRPNTYTVNYNSNGGTGTTASSSHTYGSDKTLTNNGFTRTGYTFKGWNTKANGTGTSYTNSQTVKNLVSSDKGGITLYAQWTPNSNTKYTVNHYQMNLDGSTYALKDTETKTGTSDSSLTLANLKKTYTGFTYENGKVNNNVVTTTTILPNGSRVIDLYYSRDKYYLNLNGWINDEVLANLGVTGKVDIYVNGKLEASQVNDYYTLHYYGSTFEVKNITPSKGYKYNGLKVVNDTYTSSLSGTIGTKEMRIALDFSIIDYSITYNLNGGTVTGNPSEFNIDTATFTLKNPTRTGYTFTGWTGSNGTTAQTSVSIAKGSTGNKNYTANWKVNNYTATFNGNGGPNGTSITKVYGSQLGTLPTVSREGYKFNGWFTSASGGTQISASTTMPANNVTYYAQWTPNTYTYDVVYKSSSGKSLGTSTVSGTHGSSKVVTAPSKSGYSTPSSQTVTFDSPSSKTITFTYPLIEYTIGYNLNGGQMPVVNDYYRFNYYDYTDYANFGTTYSNVDLTDAISISTDYMGSMAYSFQLIINGEYMEFNSSISEIPNEYKKSGNMISFMWSVRDGTRYQPGLTVTRAPKNRSSYNVETPTFTLNNPTKSGNSFTGWTGSNGSSPQSTVTIPMGSTGNKSYTSNWGAKSSTASLSDSSAIEIESNVSNTPSEEVTDPSASNNEAEVNTILEEKPKDNVEITPPSMDEARDKESISSEEDLNEETIDKESIISDKEEVDKKSIISGLEEETDKKSIISNVEDMDRKSIISDLDNIQ